MYRFMGGLWHSHWAVDQKRRRMAGVQYHYGDTDRLLRDTDIALEILVYCSRELSRSVTPQ